MFDIFFVLFVFFLIAFAAKKLVVFVLNFFKNESSSTSVIKTESFNEPQLNLDPVSKFNLKFQLNETLFAQRVEISSFKTKQDLAAEEAKKLAEIAAKQKNFFDTCKSIKTSTYLETSKLYGKEYSLASVKRSSKKDSTQSSVKEVVVDSMPINQKNVIENNVFSNPMFI